ncbi:molybdenum cofactor synthesis domain-containing protein [Clostridium acetobutylicum]|uniref:Molybdopterin biosynthesis protein n=1 Tax=Clostridium acetobutylicum (strain ATCC 824 / DSM 792 / JCM 1419 / IAM 19013 / LMG 5710 / NBRC 13948 / NRRL B-527 / VKM B-1787 / 2291 / W) TaxID=272562 RepID=Q97MB5_CLOAB|nr:MULTISPECIES: MogA/MoaB family molybdenum cofactor biosynthesis protein [Clostridium]AAK78264.1 Molybdopterin biosynthesis protein [Clostridium acetobutylicum ATCC 824]ADZ19331.1 Molybdopterin biosynthesis protein [Clostridium acetobutylicum EA 2018]AEI31147.1 molybdopterin biosynthesis protein [Clostridium acetobutylicum DSM 1731]AWV82114.1 MogA/MoaB family molybdenum cofactor biosynthesis protein [Clostridium acetobutylicum]AWV82163.1 MogA/MoaB family molybdenum cofactor biosynthesis prot
MDSIKFSILTLDYKLDRNDKELTGKIIYDYIKEKSLNVLDYSTIKEDKDAIKEKLIYLCEELKSDVVLTNGGTGFSKRDVMPEATLEVIEKQIPGFSEIIRCKTYDMTKEAILYRGISGIRNKSIIINLDGRPNYIRQSLDLIIGPLIYGVKILKESVSDSIIEKIVNCKQ